jgi:glycosyltransferase A (GT-A) superfamily protein (DUF2064 family)
VLIYTCNLKQGKCKTRLAATIGHEHATAFCRASILDIMQRLGGGENGKANGWRSVVLFAPSESRSGFEEMVREAGTKWDLVPMLSASAGKVHSLSLSLSLSLSFSLS